MSGISTLPQNDEHSKIGTYIVVWRRSDRRMAGSLSLHAPGKPGKSVDDLVGHQDE
jgi:hypothetical protein